VAGGSEHVLFEHSHFGALTLDGVDLRPEDDFGDGAQMRKFRVGAVPESGFTAEWTVNDRMKLLPPGRSVYLRRHDLTEGAEAGVCEGWISVGGYSATEEIWIPRLMVRRRGPDLTSTFVSILEADTGGPAVASVRRVAGEGAVALEIRRSDGMTDIVVASDPEAPVRPLQLSAWGVSVTADLARVTLDRSGRPTYIAAAGCALLVVGDLELRGKDPNAKRLIELRVGSRGPRIARGKEHVESLTWRKRPVQ